MPIIINNIIIIGQSTSCFAKLVFQHYTVHGPNLSGANIDKGMVHSSGLGGPQV